MKRNSLYTILGISLVVVVLLTMLNFTMKKPNSTLNGFDRSFVGKNLILLKEIPFAEPVREIAGMTDSAIYILTKDPYKLLRYDKAADKMSELMLKIPKLDKLASNFTITVQYPYAYVVGANVPAIIRYDLTTDAYITHALDNIFSRSVTFFGNYVALQKFDTTKTDQHLCRVNLLDESTIQQHHVVDKLHDAGFATSGILNYDATTDQITYVHFYSNRILYLDTNLNMINESSTIDTFRQYQAKAKGTLRNGKASYGYTAPPKILNPISTVNEGKLYVLSYVRADNEKDVRRKGNSTIDLYDIAKMQYRGSLYIPRIEGKRMNSFKVAKGKLYVVYEHKLMIYDMNDLLQ